MKKIFATLFCLVAFTLCRAQSEGSILKPGDQAIDFTVAMLDGKTVTLSELKGKVVLINFWATWCPPCRAEFKGIQEEVLDKFAGKDFVSIFISRGEKLETVEKFVEESGYKFSFAVDPNNNIFPKYAKQGIPRNYIVGKDGKIAMEKLGFSEATSYKELVEEIGKALQAQ